MRDRNPNLDLVRAAAIVLVLIHHIGQWLDHMPALAHRYTGLGRYGVELFFVLSGWLIGSLFFRERQHFGNVSLGRFWGRRWLRTLPPYFLVLPLAWVAVFIFRDEPFDWRYLFFLQNYEHSFPFFLVSWSLCVEEHFYLFMPLLVLVFPMFRVPLGLVLPLMVVLALTARWIDPLALPGQPFGYAEAATHLNLTGLALGLWFSWLAVYDRQSWEWIRKFSKAVVIILLPGLFVIPFLTVTLVYYLADIYIPVLFAAILAYAIHGNALPGATTRLTRLLSQSAYSLYLTHTLVLHACIQTSDRLGIAREWLVPVWIAAIMLVGYTVYRIAERPSILFRDRILPRRG